MDEVIRERSSQSPCREAAGVLLVGHGTRSTIGKGQFHALAQLVRQRLDPRQFIVEEAFLELSVPTIAQAVATLLEREVERLVVSPLLLFAAAHAKEDIPRAVRKSLADAGAADVDVRQTAHLGLQEEIVALAAERFRQATAELLAEERRSAGLVLVGRGSRDAGASGEMHAFARVLSRQAGIQTVRVAFLAMAQPALSSVLDEVQASDHRHVVVQPHLLFHGELCERLQEEVRRRAAARPRQAWIMGQTLGDDLTQPPGSQSVLCELVARSIEAAAAR